MMAAGSAAYDACDGRLMIARKSLLMLMRNAAALGNTSNMRGTQMMIDDRREMVSPSAGRDVYFPSPPTHFTAFTR